MISFSSSSRLPVRQDGPETRAMLSPGMVVAHAGITGEVWSVNRDGTVTLLLDAAPGGRRFLTMAPEDLNRE